MLEGKKAVAEEAEGNDSLLTAEVWEKKKKKGQTNGSTQRRRSHNDTRGALLVSTARPVMELKL